MSRFAAFCGWVRSLLPPYRLPAWSPEEWRAWIALLSGIVGGAFLTAFAAWVVWILAFAPWPSSTAGERIHWLGWGLMLLLAGVIAQLLSQGLAINKREIEITRDGIRIKGGGGTAATAIDKAKQAADALPSPAPEGQG